MLTKFLRLDKLLFLKPFLGLKAFRDRLLADDGFINKVAVELIIGGAAQIVAEKQNRGEAFMKELDFVVAGVATCLLANFAAVYLSAPTLVSGPPAAASGLAGWLARCPDNAFQRVLGSADYSLAQRCGALLKPVPTLFGVGFFAASGGYLYTAATVWVRKMLNPEAKGGASIPPADIAKISTVVGAYLAVSSNIRYQLVAGVIEQRFLDVVFAQYMPVRTAASALVRTGNTYVGSYLMVLLLRALGLQKMAD